ncbi:Mut7-C RNAse domain-containing protein [Ferrimonas balearica]|uniref:Mut7-C RNAse domain-containing protein n=1 Tax=Ferrimonas balearica TaxID=44012 RepID=UPI001C996F1F|nr:Mut7-C RNAse domain-containing protein [Ferrimonas balearica]MBY5991856.1 Mut7-C RNAse domain-containing protein [Ferrimonas balearica]
MSSDPPRFLADAMLLRLARWLRALGYDTLDCPGAEDRELVHRANTDKRCLLTRDRALLRELRPKASLYITSQQPLEQLTQVVADAGLPKPNLVFSRCLLCNTPLHRVDVQAPLPEYAAHLTHQPRKRCPQCQRLYWFGAHARRMEMALHRAGLS